MSRILLITSFLLTLFMASCLNDDEPSCAYIPQGKSFSACFNVSDEKSSEAETACSNLSGSFNSTDPCSSADVTSYCSKGKLDQELTNVGSTAIDLGELEFTFYSGSNSTDKTDYCSNTLSGTFVPAN